MVFDLQGVAADQVVAHVEDGPLHRAAVFVVHGCAQAGEAGVGFDLEQEAAIGERRDGEAGYFHRSHALTRGWSRTSGVEDVFGLAAGDGVGDLFDAFGVEAHGGFDRDAGVVVGADDARVILVDGTGVVDWIVNHVVIEFFLFNGAVDVRVVDEIASRGVDQRGVGLHQAEQVVVDDGVVARDVERDRVALAKERLGRVGDFGSVLGGDVGDVGAGVIDE